MGWFSKSPAPGYSLRPSATDQESGESGIGLVDDGHDVVVTTHKTRRDAVAESRRRAALRPPQPNS